MSEKEDSSIITQKERIQDFTFAYRMYISSRRDFLLGIALGVTGSITASYIVELDRTLFPYSSNPVFSILFRILLLQLVLVYLVNRYRWRTRNYENSLKGMVKRIEEINQEISSQSE